ncbi:hypothetical protein HHI36_013530 [Cryptolaemus montrouzieri]|uniref:Uncharacterized protein n=1 Tax=Cryptolaemus montrouzieri TaxID=559131 RepID=A0ABD2NHM0_9CUCU
MSANLTDETTTYVKTKDKAEIVEEGPGSYTKKPTDNKSPMNRRKLLNSIINFEADVALPKENPQVITSNTTPLARTPDSKTADVLEKNTEEWKIKKSKRRPGIYGVLQEESKMKAYEPYSHIHLSKVGLENKQQDILEFVRSKIPNISVKCEELKVKSGEYKSFKI